MNPMFLYFQELKILFLFLRKMDDGDLEKDENGNYVIDEQDREGYTVRKYRPRTEGLFARIERWTHKTNGDVHWRSISKDNILTVYGKSAKSRISDPSDESWQEKSIFMAYL